MSNRKHDNHWRGIEMRPQRFTIDPLDPQHLTAEEARTLWRGLPARYTEGAGQ